MGENTSPGDVSAKKNKDSCRLIGERSRGTDAALAPMTQKERQATGVYATWSVSQRPDESIPIVPVGSDLGKRYAQSRLILT